MSVNKQKDGKWLCLINRKGLKRVRRLFDTAKEAEIFEREYVWGLKVSDVEIKDPRTLIELINIWYQYHGINLAGHEKLKTQLMSAAHDMGNPVGHRLTPELFVKFRYQRTITNINPVTAKTINNTHALISSVYNRLKKLKIIDYANPLNEIDQLKIQERQMSYLSLKQIDELLHSITSRCLNTSTWFVVNLCLRTGARWGEAEGLTFKQLHYGRVTYEITKSKRVRTIPIDDDFYKSLLKFAEGKNPDDRIFEDCYNSFRKAIKRTEIQLVKGQLAHVLRHSFASHFMMNDGNILTLQKILGHYDIKMTLRYAHLAPNHLADAVTRNPLAKPAF